MTKITPDDASRDPAPDGMPAISAASLTEIRQSINPMLFVARDLCKAAGEEPSVTRSIRLNRLCFLGHLADRLVFATPGDRIDISETIVDHGRDVPTADDGHGYRIEYRPEVEWLRGLHEDNVQLIQPVLAALKNIDIEVDTSFTVIRDIAWRKTQPASATSEHLAALRDAWAHAGAEDRQAFLAEVNPH